MTEEDPSTEAAAVLIPDDGARPALMIESLTRNGYKRLPSTEQQIRAAAGLNSEALLARASIRDQSVPEYLSEEAIVYFIRRAYSSGDRRTLNRLFEELLGRCVCFLNGKFRWFDEQTRKDLRQEVGRKLVEDLLTDEDRGDYAQARFWRYLKMRVLDVCRSAFGDADEAAVTESLDTGFGGDSASGGSEGRALIDRQVDRKLAPDEVAMLAEGFKGLAQLPEKLRAAFVMRHLLEVEVESRDPIEPTIARHFDKTGRTIRYWLAEAERLLESFRKEHRNDP